MRSANAGFEAALDRGDVDRAPAEDDRFHAVLVQASANREKALRPLRPSTRRAAECWGRCWGNSPQAREAASQAECRPKSAEIAPRRSPVRVRLAPFSAAVSGGKCAAPPPRAARSPALSGRLYAAFSGGKCAAPPPAARAWPRVGVCSPGPSAEPGSLPPRAAGYTISASLPSKAPTPSPYRDRSECLDPQESRCCCVTEHSDLGVTTDVTASSTARRCRYRTLS
jgi:hypothetical protein